MSDPDDKLTQEERRELRDGFYVFAVAVHERLRHEGRFKDCRADVCIHATAALDSLET